MVEYLPNMQEALGATYRAVKYIHTHTNIHSYIHAHTCIHTHTYTHIHIYSIERRQSSVLFWETPFILPDNQ